LAIFGVFELVYFLKNFAQFALDFLDEVWFAVQSDAMPNFESPKQKARNDPVSLVFKNHEIIFRLQLQVLFELLFGPLFVLFCGRRQICVVNVNVFFLGKIAFFVVEHELDQGSSVANFLERLAEKHFRQVRQVIRNNGPYFLFLGLVVVVIFVFKKLNGRIRFF
jgi:hypothetical protein